MNPGRIVALPRSIICAPAGISRFAPTPTIFPASTTTTRRNDAIALAVEHPGGLNHDRAIGRGKGERERHREGQRAQGRILHEAYLSVASTWRYEGDEGWVYFCGGAKGRKDRRVVGINEGLYSIFANRGMAEARFTSQSRLSRESEPPLTAKTASSPNAYPSCHTENCPP